MKTFNHHLEIQTSRTGGFGSSDARLFYKIGSKGLESLNNTDKIRIAVAKGLREYKPVSVNAAMQKGHDFEDWFEKLEIVKDAEREVKLSKQLANNFDTFFHADFYFESTNTVFELKCVQNPFMAFENYEEQLQWQIMIFDCGLYLAVCDSNAETFEEGYIGLTGVNADKNIIETLKKGIRILDENWDTLDLTVGEDWEETDLMFWEQPEVVAMANYLTEIKALEMQAEAQKAKVLQIMLDNNIKSLKSDLYTITLVPESTTNTFDKKKLLSEHPEIKEADYTKKSERKAYIKVTLK